MPDEKLRENYSELTDAEWAIMKVLWEKESCTAGEVQETLQEERNWAYSTVKTTMDRMLKKGYLELSKIRNLQLFKSRISQSTAKSGELKRIAQRAFGGGIVPMMQHLLENENLSKSDLDQLRKLIDDSDR